MNYLDDKGCEHCDYCKYQDECHGIACYGREPVEPPCCYQESDKYLDFDIIREEMEELNNMVKEVKRPACVGEYIKIVDKHYIENEYKNGDIFKVVERKGSENVYVDKLRKDTNNNILVLYSEYVVLEGYDAYSKEYDEKLKGNDDMNKVLKLYYERKNNEIDKKYEEIVEKERSKIETINKYNELIEKFEKDMKELFLTKENVENGYIKDIEDEDYRYTYFIDESVISELLRDKYFNDKYEEQRKLKELVDEVDAQLSLSDDLGYQIEVLSNYGIIDKKSGNKLKA